MQKIAKNTEYDKQKIAEFLLIVKNIEKMNNKISSTQEF